MAIRGWPIYWLTDFICWYWPSADVSVLAFTFSISTDFLTVCFHFKERSGCMGLFIIITFWVLDNIWGITVTDMCMSANIWILDFFYNSILVSALKMAYQLGSKGHKFSDIWPIIYLPIYCASVKKTHVYFVWCFSNNCFHWRNTEYFNTFILQKKKKSHYGEGKKTLWLNCS